jgi:hypothetical protein
LSFGVALDKPLYFADFMPPVDPARSIPVLTARLTVRNTGPQPVILQFNSGQRYDLVIRDSKGDQLYQWSQGKFFTQALGRLELKGELIYLVEVSLADRSGRTYPEGRYTLEGWLSTSEGKLYTATVPFEIQYVR